MVQWETTGKQIKNVDRKPTFSLPEWHKKTPQYLECGEISDRNNGDWEHTLKTC